MKWFVPFLEQVAEVNILSTYPILFAITIDRYFWLTIIHYSINLLQFMHYIHISYSTFSINRKFSLNLKVSAIYSLFFDACFTFHLALEPHIFPLIHYFMVFQPLSRH